MEISKMLIAVLKTKVRPIVLFIVIIFGTVSFPIDNGSGTSFEYLW